MEHLEKLKFNADGLIPALYSKCSKWKSVDDGMDERNGTGENH